MKIVSTIEARMTSSRLPGKVMLPANGVPMLEHLINRLRRVPQIDDIVLATTINDTDDVLEKLAVCQGIKIFRGSEEDVMSRVIGASESVRADIVVEITGDCPIIDPEIIEQTIQLFLYNSCDYASNAQVRSFPIGMDTQVFSLKTLKQSYAMTDNPLDREHVTRHIRLNPDLFRQINLVATKELFWPELRLTLDEVQDYELLRLIIEYFGEKKSLFSCREVIDLLKHSHPEWIDINNTVIQRGLN